MVVPSIVAWGSVVMAAGEWWMNEVSGRRKDATHSAYRSGSFPACKPPSLSPRMFCASSAISRRQLTVSLNGIPGGAFPINSVLRYLKTNVRGMGTYQNTTRC